jgi:hypothetical protein
VGNDEVERKGLDLFNSSLEKKNEMKLEIEIENENPMITRVK